MLARRVTRLSVLSLVLLSTLLVALVPGQPVTVRAAAPAGILKPALAPVSGPFFIENVGQFPPAARYQARGADRTLWLTEDALWVSLTDANLRLTFPGSQPAPRLEPFDRLETHVSYFPDPDRPAWNWGVPVWAGVRYVDLYPGIDLIVSNERGGATLTLEAQQDAKVGDVQLRVEGAEGLELTADGLVVATQGGTYALPLLTLVGNHTPVAPAEVLGDVVAQPFASSAAETRSQAEMSPGAGDLLYATLFGPNGYGPQAITTDGTGAAYIKGYSYDDAFPATPGAYKPKTDTYGESFAAKLSASGSSLIYVTYLGKGSELGGDIAIDARGAAYLVGQTSAASKFPDTVGKISPCSDSSYNDAVFLVKLNETGTGAYYSTCVHDLNDSGPVRDYHLAVDGIGNAYIGGDTVGWDTSPCPWSVDTDAFVTKVNGDASAIVYGRCFSGKEGDHITDIVVGPTGSAHVVGETGSSDFPVTSGAFDTTFNTTYSGFAARLSTDGALAYSTFLEARPQAVAVDSSGAAYIAGFTGPYYANLTTTGAWDRTVEGASDAFVLKLNPAGSGLVYATLVGGKGADQADGIGLDSAGSVTLSGDTNSCDFPTTSGAWSNWFAGGTCKDYSGSSFPCRDAFVARLNPQGSLLTYGTFLGGSGNETTAASSGGVGLSLTADGSVTMGGRTDSNDFTTTSGAIRRTRGQYADGFVARLAAPAGAVVPAQCGPRPTPMPTSTPTYTPTATATPKPETKLWLTADRSDLPADGASKAVLVAKVVDKKTDAPVAGAPVSFAFEPAIGGLTPVSGTTDARGELRAVYTAPSALDLGGATEVAIRATKTKDTGPMDSDYARIELRSHKLELFVEPFEIRADGESQATITAAVTSYYGLPASDEKVEIQQPELGTISPETATTAGDGRATFTYTAPTNDKLGGRNAADVQVTAEDLSHYATGTVSLRLKSPAPLITKVRSKYAGIFLQGVKTANRYMVTVDWQKAGYGTVEFVLNGNKRTVTATGDLVGADYDMGFDMRASKTGGDNVLEITAVSKDGKLRSRTVTLQPQVMPPPPWLNSQMVLLAAPVLGASDNAARYKSSMKMPEPAYEATISVPSWVPWIAGDSGIKKGQISVDTEYDSSSSQGSMGGSGSAEVHVRNAPIGFEMGAKAVYEAVPGQGWNMDSLELSSAGGGKLVNPDVTKTTCAAAFPPVAALVNTPVIGRAVDKMLSFCTIAAEVAAKAGGAITLAYEPEGGFPYLYPTKGSFTPEIGAKAILDFKPSEEYLQFTGSGGGNLNLEMQAQPGWALEVAKANLTLALEWTVRIWKYAHGGQWPVQWSYPSGAPPDLAGTAGGPAAAQAAALTVPERQPIDATYNLFAPEQGQGLDTRLVENVYELTVPALAALPNGDLVLTWTHDDPAEPNMRGEEILASTRRNGVWQAPQAITADSQPDWHPALAVDGNGKVLAVWQRSRDAGLTTDTPIGTYVAGMEVAYAVFDPATQVWSAPAYLTNDSKLDQQIKLATAPDGRIMAAWVSNAGGELIGTNASPDTIRYAIWSGGGWSQPGDLAANVAGLTSWGLAYKGDAGVAVLGRDLDGALGGDADTELFRVNFNGTGWSAPARITSDGAADRFPQPFYWSGQPWLIWDKAGQALTRNLDGPATGQRLLAGTALEHATLRIVTDASGRLAAVWTGYENGASTLSYSVCDPEAGWGMPAALVTLPQMTSRGAPVFAPDGRLEVAYLTTEIIPPASPNAGPKPGRKDLHIVSQPPYVDLSLAAGDLIASPSEPAPGQTVTLTATVHNQGDGAAGFRVGFYDGDPAAGGPLIGALQQVLLLGGKNTASVCTTWTPPDGLSHSIFAVADPDLAVPESDETNNRASLGLLMPAPRFVAGQATFDTADVALLHATIENGGAQALRGAKMRFEDVLSGALIARVSVPDLPGGQTTTVDTAWNTAGLPAANYPVAMTLEPGQPVAASSVLSGQAVVPLLPNLSVLPEDVTFRNSSHQTSVLVVRIRNNGPRGVENVPVAVFLGKPGGAAVLQDRAVLPFVAAGGVGLLQRPWRPIGDAAAYVEIDPDAVLAETERGDNIAIVDPSSNPDTTGIWLPLITRAGPAFSWRTPVPPPTVTALPSATATRTPTPSSTLRPTYTPTAPPPTFTPSATPTLAMPPAGPTRTPTATAMPSATPSGAPSVTPSATPANTSTPTPEGGWTVLLSDGFEDTFPGSWEPLGNPTWGQTDCKARGGRHAIWPAAGGTGALTACTNDYPNNAWSVLVAGPFDLSDATAAELVFDRWQRTEYDHDNFWWLASLNGSDFFGWQSSGDTGGWEPTTFDLTDVAGMPEVWIAFGFESDETGTDLGVWVDNVVLRKK